MRRLTVLLLALPILLFACGGEDRSAEVEQLQADVEALRAQVNVLTRELEIAHDARGELARELDDLADARVESARENAAAVNAAAEAASSAAEDVEEVEDGLDVTREELAAALTWIAQVADRVDAVEADTDARDAALSDLRAAIEALASHAVESRQDLWRAVDDLRLAINDLAAQYDEALEGVGVDLDDLRATVAVLQARVTLSLWKPSDVYFRQLEPFAQAAAYVPHWVIDDLYQALSASSLADAKEIFPRVIAPRIEFSRSVAAFDPPAELAVLHGELVEAAQGVADVLVDYELTLAQAATVDEYAVILDTLTTAPEYEAAYRRYEDACLRMQEAASESGITIDLHCSGS